MQNQKRDAPQRIIWLLGHERTPQKIRTIAQKTHLTDAGVHTAIKGVTGLVRAGLLKESQPLNYVLTFRGLIEYLSLIHERATNAEKVARGPVLVTMVRKRVRKDVKEFVQGYGKFLDYVPFKEHDALNKWIGENVYDFFVDAARNVKFGYLPYVATTKRIKFFEVVMPPKLAKLGETESILNDLKRMQRRTEKMGTPEREAALFFMKIRMGKKKERRTYTLIERIATLESRRDELERGIQGMRKETEKLWMHAFSLMLFELVFLYTKDKVTRMPNEALYKHIKETLGKEKMECAGRLKEIRGMMKTFENVFSPCIKTVRRSRHE